MVTQYRIALYMRLSKEEAQEKKESDSIVTQRMLLRRYVKENFGEESERVAVREYIDM